jgi:FkbM family methyltransferase
MKPQAPLARAMRWYVNHFPISRGKGPVLSLLRRSLDDGLFAVQLDSKMALLLRKDDIVAFLTYVRGVWEPENSTILRQLLQPGDTFIDVGANLGYYAVLAGLQVGPTGHVVAFEPMPETRDWLEQNLRLNRLGNVQVMATAAAETEGEMRLHLFAGETPANASQHAAGRKPERTITVPARPLDTVLPVLPQTPALLKVDVEGGERGVFRGGKTFLAERRPIVMFELYPALGAAAGWTADELLDLLRQAGPYEFFLSAGHDLRPLLPQDVPTVDSGGHIDVFAFAADVPWHAERLQRVRRPSA